MLPMPMKPTRVFSFVAVAICSSVTSSPRHFVTASLSSPGELRGNRRAAAGDAAEDRAAHEPRRARIVEIEKPADHLAGRIQTRDRAMVGVDDLGVVRDAHTAER